MAHFYAYSSRFGVGLRVGHERKLLGTLHRFPSKSDRDAWVESPYTTGHKRAKITRRDAIKNWPGCFFSQRWERHDRITFDRLPSNAERGVYP